MFIPETTLLGQALRRYHSEQGHNWSLFLVRKIPSLLCPLAHLQQLRYVIVFPSAIRLILTPFCM